MALKTLKLKYMKKYGAFRVDEDGNGFIKSHLAWTIDEVGTVDIAKRVFSYHKNANFQNFIKAYEESKSIKNFVTSLKV